MQEKDHHKKDISVCIPTYNDENTIGQLIRETVDVLEGLQLSYEIVIIDDSSTDTTGSILENLKSCFASIVVITHRYNKGYGSTMKELLCGSSGKIIFTLPGDFQIPPQAIKKMLSCAGDSDIVVGLRKPRNDPFPRRLNSFLYNIIVNLFFHTGVSDVNSVKLIKYNVLRDIVLISNGPFIDAELCAKAVRKGFKVEEVVIEHRRRLFGMPSGNKPRVMWEAFKETFSMIGKI